MASPRTLRHIRSGVLGWYAAEHRDFPWRGVDDPYAVLVSEVMLQQTQASRIAERFPIFLRQFPTPRALADAPAAAVLAAWSGLGYNRRALALQRAARTVAEQGWPTDVASLQELPGVGPYTARAIASLAFGIPAGVVDTNVRRWLVRRFAVTDRPRDLQRLADELADAGDRDDTAAWTHASMEIGAAICTARAPRCSACPIALGCPSRGRATTVAVPRQAPFIGSLRARRGAALRALAAAAGHQLPTDALRAAVDKALADPARDAAWVGLVAALEHDGLVHRSEGLVVLGPSAGPTIGP